MEDKINLISKKGNRRKPGPVRMGIKLSPGKHIHEFLVHVEFNIGDGLPDLHNPVKGRRIPEQHGCPTQRRISQHLEPGSINVRKHAN